MSEQQKPCQHSNTLHRRGFLGASLAVTTMAFVGAETLSGFAYADALTQAQREKLTPDDILALMKKGNKRFSSGQREDHNYLAQQRASAAGQHPMAVLLSCIDSRAPAVAWPAMWQIRTYSAAWSSPANWPARRWFW
jgi:carbonic anhydrase